MTTKPSLSYKDAGVDIEAADDFVSQIGQLAKDTHTDEVVPGRTPYAGLVRPILEGLSDPLIAATCDGVGTKLMVAREAGIYRGLGQDLVAMNVNDLLPAGAKPLLFLDYIATGKLDPEALKEVVAGVAGACKASGCSLLGGETAEMPGVYAEGDFDLAGFSVGIVDERRIPDASTIEAGDVLLALPSSGVHSNGFSLVRKALFEHAGLDLNSTPEGFEKPLAETVLEPTRLYVREVLDVINQHSIKAAAHITGGGLLGRTAKLLPEQLRDSLGVRIDPTTYSVLPIFKLIQQCGNVLDEEMARTFNMGLGFVIAVSPEVADAICDSSSEWLRVGHINSRDNNEPLVDLGYAQG